MIGAFRSPTRALSLRFCFLFKMLTPYTHQVWSHTMKSVGIDAEKHWFIENFMPIRRLIQRLNTRVRTKRQSVRLDTFDFSTLYTMLAHGPLIEKMNEVFDILFAHQQLDPSCNPPRVFTHIRYHCSASDNRFEFCMSPPPPPTRAARKRKRGDPKPLKWRYLSKVELKRY